MVVKRDNNGNVVGARGSVGELKLVKTWLDSLRASRQIDPDRKNFPMAEAIDMWEKTKVVEA